MDTILQHPATPALIILGFGIFLVLIAIIGGGLEIKELKIPKIEKTGRILTGVLGMLLMVVGLCTGLVGLSGGVQAAPTAAPATTVAPPTQIPPNYQPNLSTDAYKEIRLTSSSNVSPDLQEAVKKLIVRANVAEIYAEFYQDPSYLGPVYAGDAIQRIQQDMETIKQSGYIELPDWDYQDSYYTDMRWIVNEKILAVDECEYWKTYQYDPQTSALVTETAWTLVPQTINIEAVDNNLMITSISFYNGDAFCTQ